MTKPNPDFVPDRQYVAQADGSPATEGPPQQQVQAAQFGPNALAAANLGHRLVPEHQPDTPPDDGKRRVQRLPGALWGVEPNGPHPTDARKRWPGME